MTPLRQKMIDGKASMQLRGLSPRTQAAYVQVVHQRAVISPVSLGI